MPNRPSTVGGARAPNCRFWSPTRRILSRRSPARSGRTRWRCTRRPKEFVGVTWKSPVAGIVRVGSPRRSCSSGVRQRCGVVARTSPRRQGFRSRRRGAQSRRRSRCRSALKVNKDDLLLLAVDARNGDHVCDLTEIALTITETDKPSRTWDLATDIADTVLAGNPHADSHGNAAVWSFVYGPTRPIGPASDQVVREPIHCSAAGARRRHGPDAKGRSWGPGRAGARRC